MRFDRVLAWTSRTLLAITAAFFVVVACGPPTAPDPQPDDAIEVGIVTVGPGVVRQASSDFVCRGECTWTGSPEEATGFLAVPDGSNAFVAWTGACATLDATCAHLLEDGDATTATFAPHALRLHLTGDGEGEFRIQQGTEIDFGCIEDCAVGLSQPLSLAITYFANGSTETVLDDWDGACAGADRSDYCLVPVEGATDVSKTWRRPPVAVDEAYATTRNAPLSVDGDAGVLANVVDTPGDAHTAQLVSDVENGTLGLSANGGFDYAPDPDFDAVDSFTYRVSDAFGNLSNVATVTIAVTNRPPEARSDSYFTALNEVLSMPAPGVLANDRDPDGDALTIVDPTPVSDGTLELEPDGGFTYTPEPDSIGLATFTYRVSDGLATSDPATVTIGVGLDAPVAAADAYGTFRNQSLSVDAVEGVLDNDIDPDGASLIAVLVDGVSHGALDLEPDGGFTYAPDPGFVGRDTFIYVASNGAASSVVATVTITISNRVPTAVNDTYTSDRNQILIVIAGDGLLDNDTDPDGDDLTAVLITQPTNGILDLEIDGSFTYTPTSSSTDTVTFTYAANDGIANGNTATVTITISNRAPTAVNDTYTTDVDTQLVVPAPGVLTGDTDPDGDALSVSGFTQPTNGTLTLGTDGGFTYTPTPGYVGDDTFTYTATDGIDDSDTATVTITVVQVNRAPVAEDDDYTTDWETELDVIAPGVLANDTDLDSDTLSATLIDDVSNGTLALGTDGSFTYAPDVGAAGEFTFTYVATDGELDSSPATVTITVTAPEAPTGP